MKDLRTSLLAGMTRIDSLSRRDRALLLGLTVGLLLLIWHSLIWTPLQQQGQQLQTQRVSALTEQGGQQLAIDALSTRLALDPDAENRQERERLQEELLRIEQELDQAVAGIVAPDEMPGLLARLLKQRHGLRLVRLENLTPVPMLELPTSEQVDVNLYRHPLRIELEGSYLEALTYLRAIEEAAAGLAWDRLELRVTSYPTSRILVVVHTLSSKKEWLGV